MNVLRKYKWNFCIVALVAIVVSIAFYIFLPALSISCGMLWALVCGLLTLGSISTSMYSLTYFDGCYYAIRNSKKYLVYITLTFYALWFIAGISSWEVFRATAYRKVQEEEKFSQNFEELSNNSAKNFNLNLNSAIRLGNQAIENISHSEWYKVDSRFSLITYKGKKYYLFPIVYDGFLNFIKAKSYGIPGYMLIDINTQKAEFIRLNEPIRYSPSAYFGYNLKRLLRNQFLSYIFTESFLEIDENSKPYYVTGVLRANVGVFGGKTVKSLILTDANNGNSVEYSIANAPSWIDRVNSKNSSHNSNVEVTRFSANETHTLTFTIDSMFAQDLEGTTHYYYVHNDIIYRASAKINELQVCFQIGDTVTITYIDGINDYKIVKSITFAK